MTLNKLRLQANEKGFTLIELMIVIAIIGILAIAIPNFISYRNKSFCSGAESDANSIAAAVADYFSIPTNKTISKASLQTAGVGATLTAGNTWALGGTIDNITISVTDSSKRCPEAYQMPIAPATNPRGYWNGVNEGGIYTKSMTMQ